MDFSEPVCDLLTTTFQIGIVGAAYKLSPLTNFTQPEDREDRDLDSVNVEDIRAAVADLGNPDLKNVDPAELLRLMQKVLENVLGF